MPRTTPIQPHDAEVSARQRKLRETLHIPRSEFAALLGIVGSGLTNRELGVTRWRVQELDAVKRKVAAHIASTLAAYEEAFGEPVADVPAFRSRSSASENITMKLESKISAAQRQQLEAARAPLQSLPEAINAAVDELNKYTEECDLAKASLQKATAKKGVSPEKATEISVGRTRIELLEAEIGKATAAYHAQVAAYKDAVLVAAEVAANLASPLLDQLRRELSDVLSPFYHDGRGGANICIGNHCDAYQTLLGFINDGRHLILRAAGIQQVQEEAERWSAVIDGLLSGGEIWSFKKQTTASRAG